MALLKKYTFTFESEQGAEYTINILKNNYAGQILQRALGGSPILRKDKSDNICGTSLEFPAECAIDMEFAELYTTSAKQFRVDLRDADNALVWQGFITPELYSEPDIAPPYDVVLTATDGLGELKRSTFAKRGRQSLRNHLAYLLDFTGLSLSIMISSDLRAGSGTASGMLDDVLVDLDYLAGEKCYDVLQSLLVTLHAQITQYDGKWYIYRETGLTVSHGSVSAYTGGTTGQLPIRQIGSAASASWWPVGQLSSAAEPAKNKVVITAPNNYKENLMDDELWTLAGGATYDSSAKVWNLASGGDGISQLLSFDAPLAQKLVLSIKVRNVGDGADAGNLTVTVKALGSNYTGTQYFYLTNASKARRSDAADYVWSPSQATCAVPVQAPAAEDTDDDYVEIQMIIPCYYASARDYFRADSVEVTVANASGTYPQKIYGVSLYKNEQISGYQQTVELNNGARGEASGVELAFSRVADNNYGGIAEMQYGIPVTSSGVITSWSSSRFSGLDYMSLIARDYALSIATARVRKSGTVNVPTSIAGIPQYMSVDGENYIVQTAAWHIATDELDIELLSFPSASITVEDDIVEAGETNSATGHTQGSPSGSSPGPTPTGGVTSVGVAVPTDYFTVSGSPVTSAGTITIGIKSTTKILTANEYQYIFDRAHSHSNLNVLEGITSTKTQQWTIAYNAVKYGLVTSIAGLQGDITQAQLQALVEAGESSCLAAPRLRVLYLNHANFDAPVLRVDHPLLGLPGVEAVLMVKSARNHSSYPLDQQDKCVRYRRNGWCVARGRTGSRTLSTSDTTFQLTAVLQHIARYYTRIGSRTHAQMEAMSYGPWVNPGSTTWQRVSGIHTFGWPSPVVRCKPCKVFGIAVRIANPEFTEHVVGTLSEHTQSLIVTAGGVTKTVPRYIYSEVAPMVIEIQQPPDGASYCLGIGIK